MNDDIIKIDEDAEALVNLGYAISAGEVTRADLEAMEWFKHPKTETERRYKKTFLQVLDEMEARNAVSYSDPEDEVTHLMFERAKELGFDIDNPSRENYEEVIRSEVYRQRVERMTEEDKKRATEGTERDQIKPTQAEIDEMDDFGQYISWILKHNGKAPG